MEAITGFFTAQTAGQNSVLLMLMRASMQPMLHIL